MQLCRCTQQHMKTTLEIVTSLLGMVSGATEHTSDHTKPQPVLMLAAVQLLFFNNDTRVKKNKCTWLTELIFLSFLVFLRWSGDSTGGVVSKAGSFPHPIWGGGEGLPPCPRTVTASHRLLELPWKWGRHQVRLHTTWIFFLHPWLGICWWLFCKLLTDV